MALATAHGLGSIAFPGISTGIYKFPKDAAARIAVDTVRSAIADGNSVQAVTFVCFSDADLDIYTALLQ